MRACSCPHVFTEAQARFAERLRERGYGKALGRIVIHARCAGCGTNWILLWQPERRSGLDRRGAQTDDPEA